MTDYSTLSDTELRERISEAKGEKANWMDGDKNAELGAKLPMPRLVYIAGRYPIHMLKRAICEAWLEENEEKK